TTQIQPSVNFTTTFAPDCNNSGRVSGSCGCGEKETFWRRLSKESLNATLMVIKFMALAFFLEALIILYIPEEWITTIMGQENSWAIFTAAFLGIPVYTSNLSALPMVSGLLSQGMSPAAALAFLIAGPTTTLPAMAAVWTLVKYRVFILYVSFSLAGAITLGYLKLIFNL
ncbi:MAG: permease, partial [Desulfobacterales bacterium]|nr:permease [Desulfobacterales bacterium]